jgi:hypothetical protein
MNLDHYVQRNVQRVWVSKAKLGRDEYEWSIELDGGVHIHSTNVNYEAPSNELLAGLALTRVEQDPDTRQTALYFGNKDAPEATRVNLDDNAFLISDYERDIERMSPADFERDLTPPPHPDERIVTGPEPSAEPKRSKARTAPKKSKGAGR